MNRTKIAWAHWSWNPVRGCTRVSEACLHCYALEMAHRFKWPTGVTLHPERLPEPYRQGKDGERVFVCSMSDLFHDCVPDEFIQRVWEVMHDNERLTFVVLTKRPKRLYEWTTWQHHMTGWRREDVWPENVWLGVTAENQQRLDERVPVLLRVPAKIHWLSAEPLLGALDVSRYFRHAPSDCLAKGLYGADCSRCDRGQRPAALDWVVVGGESGRKARPMFPEWPLDLQRQCAQARVAFYFKQWGAWVPTWGAETHLVYKDGRCVEGTHDNPDAWRGKIAHPIMRMPRADCDSPLSEYRNLPRQFPKASE